MVFRVDRALDLLGRTRGAEVAAMEAVDDAHWSDWGTPEAIERTLMTPKQVPPWRRSPATAAA